MQTQPSAKILGFPNQTSTEELIIEDALASAQSTLSAARLMQSRYIELSACVKNYLDHLSGEGPAGDVDIITHERQLTQCENALRKLVGLAPVAEVLS